jgi:hypothetical protein
MAIESRLKELEKRARVDDERWQTLGGQLTALPLIFRAIGIPICALNPSLLSPIIKNLRAYEKAARLRNDHDAAIQQFRLCREAFEAYAEEIGKGASPLEDGDEPRKQK